MEMTYAFWNNKGGTGKTSLAFQAITQGLVILDDSVMHDGQAARDVRVRIALARYAMGGPARMGDASVAAGLCFFGLGRQFSDPADCAQALQACLIDQCQSGRVVAAIFQPTQAFEKNRNDIAVGDRCYDATHD